MTRLAIPFCVAVLTAAAASQVQAKSLTTAANREDCKVVEMKPGSGGGSGSGMSSSVTAGGGRVSGQTTMPDGSVSSHSGSSVGSGSSSSSSSAASSADGTTIVTNSDGSCTIFVDPDKQKDKSR